MAWRRFLGRVLLAGGAIASSLMIGKVVEATIEAPTGSPIDGSQTAEMAGLVQALERAAATRVAAEAAVSSTEMHLGDVDRQLAQISVVLQPLEAIEDELVRSRASASEEVFGHEAQRTPTPKLADTAEFALQNIALRFSVQAVDVELAQLAARAQPTRVRRAELSALREQGSAGLGAARHALHEARTAEDAALQALRAAEERRGLWSREISAGTIGIPQRVLDILQWTEAKMDIERPSCGLDWGLLAAISQIESNHGRFRGAVLQRDGSVDPPIRGVSLDGFGVALIADTDGGRIDGDTVVDRAVGPFQFIPSTWALYGHDGNGDGLADPQNFWDASLSAAGYLCATGKDLRRPAGERRAILAYNQSNEYLADVQALAYWYRRFRPGFNAAAPEPPPTTLPTTTLPTTTLPTTTLPTTTPPAATPTTTAPSPATTMPASSTSTTRPPAPAPATTTTAPGNLPPPTNPPGPPTTTEPAPSGPPTTLGAPTGTTRPGPAPTTTTTAQSSLAATPRTDDSAGVAVPPVTNSRAG